ncbi:hypothetical protein [Serratia sp. M24T3]|uniref:hypothetical protein n=1 Tax=Serratia sp. M24T3 TaxID=932213 RepID=UPI00025BA68A|nr:hypothetical protein [Serratia sp. M24T3]EIC85275.1 hypothetical protein SPM24T3_07549 [Serratia sp. M24T3]
MSILPLEPGPQNTAITLQNPCRTGCNPFSRLITGIRNIFRRPTSLVPSPSETKLEIGNSEFHKYLYKPKKNSPQPRIYSGIKFENATEPSLQIKKPFKCNGDTFIDPSFYKWKAPKGSQMKNCFFTARDHPFNWDDPQLGNICMSGSTIEGLYKDNVEGDISSLISPCLSGIKMKHCILNNLIFTLKSLVITSNVDFSHSRFDNVTFTGSMAGSGFPYYIREANFENISASGLTFKNVSFESDVSFKGAQITNLTLCKEVNFKGVTFGDYQPRQITLSDEMFSSSELIDLNLNSINNTTTGAYFFNTLGTIENRRVKVDWAEQLVEKFSRLDLLKNSLQQSSICESLIYELSIDCFKDSLPISNFVWELQVEKFKFKVIPGSLLQEKEIFQKLVNSLINRTRTPNCSQLPRKDIFSYQFLANQLFDSYPEMAQAWNQLAPLPELLKFLNEDILMNESENFDPQHVFYDPQTRRAIAIPKFEFNRLINELQAPTQYSLFQYLGEGNIVNLPASQQALSMALSCSEGLQQLWSASGNYFKPTFSALLVGNSRCSSQELIRLNEIKQHLASLLLKRSAKKMNLTGASEAILLHSALADYYEGEHAVEKRQPLIDQCFEDMQPCFAKSTLNDNQKKAIISLLLARVLITFSSSAFCGTETDSPMPLRLLADAFLEDSINYWPELVSAGEMKNWREKLIPKDSSTFSCSAMLSGNMATYRHPIIDSEDLPRLMKTLYPL